MKKVLYAFVAVVLAFVLNSCYYEESAFFVEWGYDLEGDGVPRLDNMNMALILDATLFNAMDKAFDNQGGFTLSPSRHAEAIHYDAMNVNRIESVVKSRVESAISTLSVDYKTTYTQDFIVRYTTDQQKFVEVYRKNLSK